MSEIKPLALCLQLACVKHRWIRSSNASHIYERPERIRAVLLGAAAAVSRLESSEVPEGDGKPTVEGRTAQHEDGNVRESTPDVSDLLGSLNLSGSTSKPQPRSDVSTPNSRYLYTPQPVQTEGPSNSNGSRTLLTHPALQIVHAPLEDTSLTTLANKSSTLFPQSPYLKQLCTWALEAPEKIKRGECEIPSRYDPGVAGMVGEGKQGDSGSMVELNQNDLYLGPGSVEAIEGCVKTVCQAIDLVCTHPSSSSSSSSSAPTTPSTSAYAGAFCVIRPPGHHCAQDFPSGFCYVNNAAVAAMHGYLDHEQDRTVFIDIDLHHGNGTQSIVMGLNESSHAEDLLIAGGKPLPAMTAEEEKNGRRRRNWKGFYGSVHDIWSYPCEDGDLDLIKDASVRVAAHGQHINNIHLEPYTSDEDFYERIYPRYSELLISAERFIRDTEAIPERTTVVISAGFDACEHEHDAMSRHQRRVPTSFFDRITRDIRAFGDKFANGKVISVLEGGYSDKALSSGALAHVSGFFPPREGRHGWWSESSLADLERISKRKRNGILMPLDSEAKNDPHLLRTRALLESFESAGGATGGDKTDAASIAAPRWTLRERKKAEPVTPTATPRSTARAKAVRPEITSPPNETPLTPVPVSKSTAQVDDMLDKLEDMAIKAKADPDEASSVVPADAPRPKLRGLDKDSEEVRYSKTLAYMLRHGAEKERLPMRKDGYVRVVDMLSHAKLKSLSWPLLHHLVVTNAKQRFVLFYGFDPSPIRPTYQKKGSARKVDTSGATEVPLVALVDPETVPTYDPEVSAPVSGPPLRDIDLSEGQHPPPGVQAEYFIRAAQGHSLPTVTTEHLEPVANDETGRRMVGEMVHGSKEELWDVIREQGLSKMSRQHIHLTTAREGAKSGPRNNSTLFIYLSLAALSLHTPPIPVYLSTNGVVLTPGDERGFVRPEMFERVVRVRKERIVQEEETTGVEVSAVPAPTTEETSSSTATEAVQPNRATEKTTPDATTLVTASKRPGKSRSVGVRFWDEVIWEHGATVDPPRRLGGFSMRL